MNDHRTYLDHNATTVLRPEARDAMMSAMDLVGAASSIHTEGRAARALLEKARTQLATLVGAEPKNVVFTSGATEANAMALLPAWHRRGEKAAFDRCLVSAIEHVSVLKGAGFPSDRMEVMPVGSQGVIDRRWVRDRLSALAADGFRPMVSLMLANNETGIIQPVADLAETVHAVGGVIHSDAAQAGGKIPVSIAHLGVDFLTLSSHKLGGPMGAGALISRSDALHLRVPLIRGGGQERGARAGTENLAAIAGFGAAAAAALRELSAEPRRQRALRDRLESGLSQQGAVIFGSEAERLPNTTCFAVPGVLADIALIRLDLDGFAISSGSACSSGKVADSHVLAAMGVNPDLARCALRISLGRATTPADVESFLSTFQTMRESLHARRRTKVA